MGRLVTAGPEVDRARYIVERILPPYVPLSRVRVYVVENPDWNAMAMANYSIYVFSGLMADLVLEVLSEADDTYLKFPFYEARGVREILIVDSETRRVELWRREDSGFEQVAPPLRSLVTGLLYSRAAGALEVSDPACDKTWRV